MQQKTVLLLFGGESSEHDVSVASARNVYAAIDDSKYSVELGYIDHHGKWWLLDRLSGDISTQGAPQLAPVLGTQSFVTFPSGKVIKPDVILPILHGQRGEDGTVQGLAELMHVPIVGCDMTSSSICMDKLATKNILHAAGIDVVPFEIHHAGTPLPDFNKLSMTLGSPLFVKPARSGSSIGVSKVYSDEEFTKAIHEAHKHGNVVLIETGVSAREIETGVLGNIPDVRVSVAGEIKSSGAEFYDYEAKYSSGSSELIIPAPLEPGMERKIRDLSERVYTLLGCSGLARIDFFLLDDDTLYVNEVNTIPGFTNSSMYARLWREDGIPYSQLVQTLLDLALKTKETE